jgi:hypothetical protein
MVPGASLGGTVLVTAELDHAEIKRHVRAALGIVSDDDVLDLHPAMRPDDGFIEMVSVLVPLSSSWICHSYVLHCLTQRLKNCRGISALSPISTVRSLWTRNGGRGIRLTPRSRRSGRTRRRRRRLAIRPGGGRSAQSAIGSSGLPKSRRRSRTRRRPRGIIATRGPIHMIGRAHSSMKGSSLQSSLCGPRGERRRDSS